MAAKAQVIDFLLSGYRTNTTDNPLTGGTVEVFDAGTSNAAYVWDDRDKTLPTTTGRSTITLDIYGRAEVYGDGIYKFVIKDFSGAAIETIDFLEYLALDSNGVASVATISALRSLDISNRDAGSSVRLVGYSDDGDGGEGPDRYLSKGQPSGTYVDNGGSIIVPTGGDGSAAWLTPQSSILGFLDGGAVGDGVSDDTSVIQALLNAESIVNADEGTYLVRQAVMDNAVVIQGVGVLKQDQLEKHIISFIDNASPSSRVRGIKIIGPGFGPMPDSVADDFAAISFANSDAPIVALSNIDTPHTGIRLGYVPGGAESLDPLVLGVSMKDVQNFGVECINSSYPRIIGLATNAGGTPTGFYGVRFTGETKGAILVGSSIKDAGLAGVSIQNTSQNCLVVGSYIENSGSGGIQTSAASTIAGSHLISGTLIKNSGNEGIDLDFARSWMVDALIDSPAGVGLRLSSVAAEGKHLINCLVRDSAVTAASVGSDKNHVRLLVDGGASGTPVVISGSNNLVEVMCSDTTVTNTVYVTGSNNVVLVNESGTGSIGCRVDGSNNTILGNVTGDLLVTGNTNKVSGVVAGTITDTGTGNDISGILGCDIRGLASTTTAADGTVTVTHGMKITPAHVEIEYTADAPVFHSVTAKAATTFTVKFWDSAGSVINAGAVAFTWRGVAS